MNPYLWTGAQFVAFTLLILLGVWLGRVASRFPQPVQTRWMAYCLPLIFLIAIPVRLPQLKTQVPFQWLHAGFTDQYLFAFFISFLFTLTGRRSNKIRTRVLWGTFGSMFILLLAVPNVVGPLVSRQALMDLETTINLQGVCIQSNGYTCGPAAAVTLLRRRGIQAEESELSLASRCSSLSGTTAEDLVRGMKELYGVSSEILYPSTLEELSEMGEVLILTKFTTFIDHWVVVLEITPDEVLIANPLQGLQQMTHVAFNSMRRDTVIRPKS